MESLQAMCLPLHLFFCQSKFIIAFRAYVEEALNVLTLTQSNFRKISPVQTTFKTKLHIQGSFKNSLWHKE